MRGISEERLKEIAKQSIKDVAFVVNVLLIKECVELNGWKPIDENTPKDRRIMLFYERCGIHTGVFRNGKFVADADHYNSNFNPTHWQDPLPPKE